MNCKKYILWCLLLIANSIFAQSRISLYGGWTASKIRAIYDKQNFQPGPVFEESFTNLPFWHTPYMGIEYEYDYKKLRLSTGFIMMSMGAGATPSSFGYWVVAYWTLPILGGYHLKLNKGWAMTFEGGVEIGFQNGKHIPGLHTSGTHWGNINLVAAVETEWKNFRLGVRGHLGVTTFRTFDPITYKHTALTTYLGYTLWDHAQCKARRLKKLQEKNLDRVE